MYIKKDGILQKPDSPRKEGYTFAGWVTENEGNIPFNFDQNITMPTSIYASWTKASMEVTQSAFSDKVREIISNMKVASTITKEEFGNEIKAKIDDFFQIDSNVDVLIFELSQATNGIGRELRFYINATYRECLSGIGGTLPVEESSVPPQDRSWILDEVGNLIINSQTGMDDWVQNGRIEESLLAVKNVLIQGGVAEIPANAFSGCSNLISVSIPDTVTGIGNFA